MPPKKVVEAPPPPEAPDQPPTFDSEPFVDGLLMQAKRQELALVEEGVAAAVGMADDFRVNLRNGVAVDFTVECVLFASQHNFSARKTSAFVKWMTELRTCVESTGSPDAAKELFRSHVIASAEKTALASTSAPPAEEPAAAEAPAKGGKPAAGGGGKGATGKGKGADAGAAAAVQPETRDLRNDPAVALTLNDLGPVADFVVTGVLQHWRLYHHVASADIASSRTADYTLAVQIPMAAPALCRALPAEQYEAQQDALRRKADDELEALQQEEAERAEAERRAEERVAEAARLAEEEAQANALYFEKQGTDKAVALVHEEVQGELTSKQQSIVNRLARIEELLQLQSAA